MISAIPSPVKELVINIFLQPASLNHSAACSGLPAQWSHFVTIPTTSRLAWAVTLGGYRENGSVALIKSPTTSASALYTAREPANSFVSAYSPGVSIMTS